MSSRYNCALPRPPTCHASGHRRWEDLWKVKLHCIAITGFLLGGVAGRVGYQKLQETALVINISILFVLGVLHTRESLDRNDACLLACLPIINQNQ